MFNLFIVFSTSMYITVYIFVLVHDDFIPTTPLYIKTYWKSK